MEPDASCHLLSAEEMMTYRLNKNKLIPNRGPKSSEVNEAALEKYYAEQEKVVSEEKVEKLGSLSQAEYYEESNKIELVKSVGKSWQKMGYCEVGKKYLYPEEALYLLESVRLEIYQNKIPLSIEEAYALFLNEFCTLEQFQVYTHLSRLGYIVVRYQVKCKESPPYQETKHTSGDKRQCTTVSPNTEIILDKEDSLENISSDDQDGLYIVYESLPRKKIKLHEEEISSNGQILCDSGIREASGINMEELNVEFPNAAGKTFLHLSIPPNILLPNNVHITESMCLIDLEKITLESIKKKKITDCADKDGWKKQGGHFRNRHAFNHKSSEPRRSPHRNFHKPRDHRQGNFCSKPKRSNQIASPPNKVHETSCQLFRFCQENGIKSWKEYKAALAARRDEETLLQSPAAHLWTCSPKPLVEPKDAIDSEAVRKRLFCVSNVTDLPMCQPSCSKQQMSTSFKISYDVYVPKANYKKSSPPLPNHRIVIVKSTDPIPTLDDIASLEAQTKDSIPIQFAVVDNGNVAFYSFNNVSLPIIT